MAKGYRPDTLATKAHESVHRQTSRTDGTADAGEISYNMVLILGFAIYRGIILSRATFPGAPSYGGVRTWVEGSQTRGTGPRSPVLCPMT